MFKIPTPSPSSLLRKSISGLWPNVRGTEIVGLDISEHALFAATLAKFGRQGKQVKATQPQPEPAEYKVISALPPIAWESRGIARYAHALSEFNHGQVAPIKHLLLKAIDKHVPRQADGGTRSLTAVLPPIATVLRWPTADQQSELAKSIRADLGASLEPGDSIQTCSWPIGDSGRKMIYAVSGGLTSALARQLTRLGFQSPIVDSRPHALARAIGLDEIGDSNIIIDWSWHACTLLIATNASDDSSSRTPQLCRPLHGYSLSANERVGGNAARQTGAGYDTNRQHFSPLFRAAADEIRRTLRFAESLAGVDASGPILICGPAALIPSASQILSESLRRQVRSWKWGGSVRPPQHDLQPDDALFAVAIGAACGTLI